MEFDHLDHWNQFLLGDERVVAVCQTFLERYVEDDVKTEVVLGPGETEVKRQINTGTTIQDAWQYLVQVADIEVMEPKQRANPLHASFYSLSYSSRYQGSMDKPAYQITYISLLIYSRISADRIGGFLSW